MEIYDFPSDDGRHMGVNESWWLGCYVTSAEQVEYSILVMYVVRHPDEMLYQVIGIQNLQTGVVHYTFNIYDQSSYSYNYDKWDFSIGSDERWYQIHKDPYEYRYISRFIDMGLDVSLDLKITSNKGATIQTTLSVLSPRLNNTAYYDHTNCHVAGTIKIGSTTEVIKGTGYISREWGKKLGGEWQWSAIQLDNNIEICAAKYQSLDGVKSEGWIVSPEGMVKQITDLSIQIVNYSQTWWSEKWLLTSEIEKINLTIDLKNNLSKIEGLHEGICSVEGFLLNKEVSGICFSEQTVRFPNN